MKHTSKMKSESTSSAINTLADMALAHLVHVEKCETFARGAQTTNQRLLAAAQLLAEYDRRAFNYRQALLMLSTSSDKTEAQAAIRDCAGAVTATVARATYALANL